MSKQDMGMNFMSGVRAFWPLGLIIAAIFGGAVFLLAAWWWALAAAVVGFVIGVRLPFIALMFGG